MKKVTLKKIIKYCSFASAGISTNANADIIYTNIEPDYTFTDNSYIIDLNNDAISDFKITHDGTNKWIFIEKTGNNAQVVGSLQPDPQYGEAYFFTQSQTISSNNSWINSSINKVSLGFRSDSIYGDFQGMGDGMIGVSFDISGATHYGWIRINIPIGSDSITVKDFAFNSIPGESIIAGQLPLYADSVTNINVNDITDNLDASDISFSFTKGNNESSISNYSAFIIPENEANGFNEIDFFNTNSNNLFLIEKTGLDINSVFGDTINDLNNNKLIQGFPYKIGVVSNPAGVSTNAKLVFSETFTLDFDTLPLSSVSNFISEDINNNLNSSDIRLTFDYNDDLDYVKEFRIFAVKEEKSTLFNESIANNTPHFLTLYPFLHTISQVLPSTMKDTDGELLQGDSSYCFFVMALNKGIPPYAADFLSNIYSCINFNSVLNINSKEEFKFTIIKKKGLIEISSNTKINTIQLLSLNGELLNEIFNSNSIQIPASKGLFFLRVMSNKQFITKKILLND